jgi:predicted nucleic acid-binding protein
MKVLIDTNIILDILLAREPFLSLAKKLIHMIDHGEIQAYITANSITDIVYIIRKTYSLDEIRHAILSLLNQIDVIDVCRNDILAAFELGFNDFEDALQSSCAERARIEYIVTRNQKDFVKSKVAVIGLSEFLSLQQK